MIHDADYQMSLSCGQNDPLNMLKNSFFSCLIGIYFSPFFFEHTVAHMEQKKFLKIFHLATNHHQLPPPITTTNY